MYAAINWCFEFCYSVVVVTGWPFLRRLINSTCGLTKPFHHLSVTKSVKQDLDMWLMFLEKYNGVSVFHDRFWVTNRCRTIYWQCGWSRPGIWCSLWPQMDSWHLAWKVAFWGNNKIYMWQFWETFPILVSLVIWIPSLRNKKIMFQSDNESVTYILNTMNSRSENITILLSAITLQCM